MTKAKSDHCNSQHFSDTEIKAFKRKAFLHEAELAERWSIAKKTLENARYAGRAPRHYKLLGSIRYAISEIQAYERDHALNSSKDVWS